MSQAVDWRDRVLTRDRLKQLREVVASEGAPRSFQYWGPSPPLDRLLDEREPATQAVNQLEWRDGDDAAPWIAVTVYIEPDWRIEPASPHFRTGQWKVYEDRGQPTDGGDIACGTTFWMNEELARRYVELLTDNFWTEHPQP